MYENNDGYLIVYSKLVFIYILFNKIAFYDKYYIYYSALDFVSCRVKHIYI